jgi:AcrR family transcriptional regulator
MDLVTGGAGRQLGIAEHAQPAEQEDRQLAALQQRNDRRAPGRPRSERASQAIIMATLDLLLECGSVDSFSIEAVAARAGVGKATLYRRWPNKEALVLDALASLYEPPVRANAQSVRQNLIIVVEDLCRWAAHSISGRLFPRLLGASAELQAQYVQSVIEPRKVAIREVLRKGVRDGELAPDIDVEHPLTMLFGWVLSRLLMPGKSHSGEPRDGGSRVELIECIVDQVLSGIGVGSHQGTQPRRSLSVGR